MILLFSLKKMILENKRLGLFLCNYLLILAQQQISLKSSPIKKGIQNQDIDRNQIVLLVVLYNLKYFITSINQHGFLHFILSL